MIKIEKKDLAILAISFFHVSAIAVNQFIPMLETTFNLSLNQAETIITLNSISAIVFLLLSNRITEAIGMKKGVILGLGFIVLSGIIPVLSKSLIGVILNRLLLGAGIGTYAANSSTYISKWYSGHKKAKLLGFRGASEMLGVMALIYLAGLFGISDRFYGFIVYILAIIPLLFFAITVDDKGYRIEEEKVKFKFNKVIIFYMILSIFLLMNTNAMNIRFPNVAKYLVDNVRIIGILTMVIMFFGMLGGIFFGRIYRIFKTYTLPFGLILILISNILIIFSEKNILLLVTSIALSAFAQSFVIAYTIGDMENQISKDNIAYATSLLFVFHNCGMMIAPYFLIWMQRIFNFNSLTMPFVGFIIIMLMIVIYSFINLKNEKEIKILEQ